MNRVQLDISSASNTSERAVGFPQDAKFRNFVSHSAHQSPVASKRGHLDHSSLSASNNKTNLFLNYTNKEEFWRSGTSASIDKSSPPAQTPLNHTARTTKAIPRIEIPGGVTLTSRPHIAAKQQHLYNIEEAGDSPSPFPHTPGPEDIDLIQSLITRGTRIWQSPTQSARRE